MTKTKIRYRQALPSSASSTRAGVSGRNGTRTPIALATAFEMAAPGETTGGSANPMPPQDGPFGIGRRRSSAHDGGGRRRRGNHGRRLGGRPRQRDNHIVTRFGGTQHRRQGDARARLATAVA